MISIVGLGNAASAIVDCFKETPQYNSFQNLTTEYNFL